MESPELKKILETLLFITDSPLSIKKIANITEEKEEIIKDHIMSLQEDYERSGSTFQIRQTAGGWQMATRTEYSIWVRKLYNTKMTVRLTQAALETLCIVAYKQPITKSEIEAVRGVDSSGPLDTLTQRRLIYVSGRKEIPGRPLLYATTQEFLRQFGLNTIKDLPKLETFAIENPAMAAQGTAVQMADNSIRQKSETQDMHPEQHDAQQIELFPDEKTEENINNPDTPQNNSKTEEDNA